MKKIFHLIVLIVILFSCNDKNEPEPYPNYYSDAGLRKSIVFRIKDTSFFNYVPVCMKEDFSKIKLVPEKAVQDRWIGIPIALDSSYYYEPSTRKIGIERYFSYGGLYTAILDVKLANFKDGTMDSNTMFQHILNYDIFSEFYAEIDSFVIYSSSPFQQDTSLLNKWIRKGELGNHLKRLK